MTSTLERGNNYGIPPRTPASTALWAHLLRKETLKPAGSTTGAGMFVPPITPFDKNGTSMRILLHDTQAHLDKFSDRADKLFAGVEETKREISMVNTLFQREHETLTGEFVDLVNRSQTRLQTCIGTPAQADKLEILSKDLRTHLDALEKRIDAIQLFNHTHSQTLQLQSQALQSLQDQHGTVLAALLPILPLLQAMPLHIESARNHITDKLSISINPSAHHPEASEGAYGIPKTIFRSGDKRPGSTLDSDMSPFQAKNKRARTASSSISEPNAITKNTWTHYPKTEQTNPMRRTSTERSLTSPSKRMQQEAVDIPGSSYTPLVKISTTRDHSIPGKRSPKLQMAIPTTVIHTAQFHEGPVDSTSSLLDTSGDNALFTMQPPCILHAPHSTPPRHCIDNHPTSAITRQGNVSTVHLPVKLRTPLASFAQSNSSPLFYASTGVTPLPSRTLAGRPLLTSQHMSRLSTPLLNARFPLVSKPLQPPLLSSGKKKQPIVSPVAVRHSARSSRQNSRATSPLISLHRSSALGTPQIGRASVYQPVPGSISRPLQPSTDTMTLLPSARIKCKVQKGPSALAIRRTKVRERRSPFRQGRRFIPLGDSDEDDEIEDIIDKGG